MSTGLFAITDALTAHQASQDEAISAVQSAVAVIQSAPPSGITQAQLDAVSASVTALAALVGTPTPAAPAPEVPTAPAA